MDNKLVMISIAAVIGVIVLGSVLMPILDDATTVNETFTNEGIISMNEIPDDLSTTLTWNSDTNDVINVGDETITMPTDITYPLTIMFSDDWMVRATPAAGGGLGVLVVDVASSDYIIGAGGVNVTFTATIASGSVTFTVGETSITKSVDGGLIITADTTPDYVLKHSTYAASVLGDSVVYGVGRTENIIGTDSLNAKFTGSIDDGLTALYAPNTWTMGTITISSSQISGYNNLYSLTSFATTVSDGDDTADVNYSQFFVPAEVTAERSVHFTAGQNAIFAAIPVMIILAVLLGVVALVIRPRMD